MNLFVGLNAGHEIRVPYAAQPDSGLALEALRRIRDLENLTVALNAGGEILGPCALLRRHD